MNNLSNKKLRHFIYFTLICLIAITGCFDTVDVLNTVEPTTYVRDPSRDIQLQVPDHLIHIPSLWNTCPENVTNCTPHVDHFTDKSNTLSGIMAMTEDRIYVPDGAGLNIYAFNHKGEFMEDETISREPLGKTGHNTSPEGTSSDRCHRIVTNGTEIYIEVRYTKFRSLINYEAIVSYDIASKSLIKAKILGDVVDRRIDLAFATDDLLYLKYYPHLISQKYWDLYAKDIFRAYSKHFIEPQPDYNIQLQHDYQFPWQREGIPPASGSAFSIPIEDITSGNVSEAAERALSGLTNVFYDHDHQLIYIEAANNAWGAFHINGEYADIEFVSEKWHGSPQYMKNRVYFIEAPREEGVKGEYYIRCYSAGGA